MINITSADVQQLAQGIVPAYLQRHPLPELVQELATRLAYAEKVINDACYTYDRDPREQVEEMTAKLEEYDERKDDY